MYAHGVKGRKPTSTSSQFSESQTSLSKMKEKVLIRMITSMVIETHFASHENPGSSIVRNICAAAAQKER